MDKLEMVPVIKEIAPCKYLQQIPGQVFLRDQIIVWPLDQMVHFGPGDVIFSVNWEMEQPVIKAALSRQVRQPTGQKFPGAIFTILVLKQTAHYGPGEIIPMVNWEMEPLPKGPALFR